MKNVQKDKKLEKLRGNFQKLGKRENYERKIRKFDRKLREKLKRRQNCKFLDFLLN